MATQVAVLLLTWAICRLATIDRLLCGVKADCCCWVLLNAAVRRALHTGCSIVLPVLLVHLAAARDWVLAESCIVAAYRIIVLM